MSYRHRTFCHIFQISLLVTAKSNIPTIHLKYSSREGEVSPKHRKGKEFEEDMRKREVRKRKGVQSAKEKPFS